MFRRPILVLTAASILVHVGLMATVIKKTGSITGYAFQSRDSDEYYSIARNLTTRGSFSLADSNPDQPDTWRTPGYPLFLAGLVLLFGDSPSACVIAQQLLSVINVLLFFLVSRRLLGDRRALAVSLLFLIEPYHLFYSAWLLATTLYTTSILLMWYAWQPATAKVDWRWYAIVGMVAGAAVLIRPIGALIPPALLAGLAVMRVFRNKKSVRRLPLTRTITGLLALGVGTSFMVAPWMLRNKIVAGHFALSDQSGVVLAYFKATEVALWSQGRTADRYKETSLDEDRVLEPHTVWDRIDIKLRHEFPQLPQEKRELLTWRQLAQGNRAPISSFEVSSALSRIGWTMLAESPTDTILCYAARCVSILTFPLELALNPPAHESAGRLRRAAVGSLYALLAIGAAVRLARGPCSVEDALLPAVVIVALLAATTPQLDPRFRVPMIPFLLFLALMPKRPKTAHQESCGSARDP